MSRKSNADRQEAIDHLRSILKPGDTVWTDLRSVSRSGMSRKIGVHFFEVRDGKIERWWLTRFVATATGYRFDEKTECLSVSGCGMDMGFAVVYDLSRALFPEGFKVEGTGRNGDKSGWDNDGGYALKQRWI